MNLLVSPALAMNSNLPLFKRGIKLIKISRCCKLDTCYIFIILPNKTTRIPQSYRQCYKLYILNIDTEENDLV